eukprot:4691486-Alexandrium_andersonii.AAC.1
MESARKQSRRAVKKPERLKQCDAEWLAMATMGIQCAGTVLVRILLMSIAGENTATEGDSRDGGTSEALGDSAMEVRGSASGEPVMVMPEVW